MSTKRRTVTPRAAAAVRASPGATARSVEPSDAAGDRPDYRVEALAKGLRILSLFSEQRPTWRISDIAAAVGMPLPTVYRVVMTLASSQCSIVTTPASRAASSVLIMASICAPKSVRTMKNLMLG